MAASILFRRRNNIIIESRAKEEHGRERGREGKSEGGNKFCNRREVQRVRRMNKYMHE